MPPPPEYLSTILTRKSHIFFLLKIFCISSILLACAILQWALIVKIKSVVQDIRAHNYLILIIILAAFLIMLCFSFFYKMIIRQAQIFRIIYAFFTVEFGTVVIVRPILEASQIDLVYSGALTLVVIFMSVIFSIIKLSPADLENDANHLTEWAIKAFLLSSLGVLVVMSIKSPDFELGFVSFILVIHFFFILKFGNIIGDFDFYQAETDSMILFVILGYYNYLTMYSNALLFFIRCRSNY